SADLPKTPKVQPADKTGDSPTAKPLSEKINSIGMEFVLISAGEFLMGSSESDGAPDERPQHKVRISPFYLGATEVTRGQFRRYVNEEYYQTEAEKDGAGSFGWSEEVKWFVW